MLFREDFQRVYIKFKEFSGLCQTYNLTKDCHGIGQLNFAATIHVVCLDLLCCCILYTDIDSVAENYITDIYCVVQIHITRKHGESFCYDTEFYVDHSHIALRTSSFSCVYGFSSRTLALSTSLLGLL